MATQFRNYKPRSKKEIKLVQAFLTLKSTQETLNFLRDLLTPKELEEFSRRLKIAQLLESTNLSYDAIAKKMRTSTTTVTRVALWLNNGCGGYKSVLRK